MLILCLFAFCVVVFHAVAWSTQDGAKRLVTGPPLWEARRLISTRSGSAV